MLDDVDRKIYLIIRNNTFRGRYITIEEISIRSGYSKESVKKAILFLIQNNWIKKGNKKWIIVRHLE